MKSKLLLGLFALGFIMHSCSVEDMEPKSQTYYYQLKVDEIIEKKGVEESKDSISSIPKGGEYTPPGG